MTDLSLLEGASRDTLAALILELAAQLHVERARRMALEAALEKAGLLPQDAVSAAGRDEGFRSDAQAALDEALEKLLSIVTEDGPPQHPLREEAD